MYISAESLKEKILEFYPEIGRHNLEYDVMFDDMKNAWVVYLKKGNNTMYTHIEVEDAKKCLEGIECIYLGTQIGVFLKNFCGVESEVCEV